MRSLIAAVVVVFATSACDSGGPLPVRKVLVDVEPGAAIDREDVRGVVNSVLNQARGIELVSADAPGAVLRVRVEGYGPAQTAQTAQVPDAAKKGDPPKIADDGPSRTTLALTVELTSVPNDTSAGAAGYRGHAIASGAGIVDARSLVGQALRDALAQVLMTRGAADLDSKELISWLEDEGASDEQKRRAARILGSRRERAAVDALARVLHGGNQELEPLALAALTNIGDPGAVDAVIAYSDRKPSVLKKQCIEAVRAMGSPRGKAWLFTLSSGHPDADVQQQAAAALAALEGADDANGTKNDAKGAAVAETATAPKNEATR